MEMITWNFQGDSSGENNEGVWVMLVVVATSKEGAGLCRVAAEEDTIGTVICLNNTGTVFRVWNVVDIFKQSKKHSEEVTAVRLDTPGLCRSLYTEVSKGIEDVQCYIESKKYMFIIGGDNDTALIRWSS